MDLSIGLTDEAIATAIANLFKYDGLTFKQTLESKKKEPIFKTTPWEEELTDSIAVFPGENLLWINKQPNSESIQIENVPVEVNIQPQLDINKYNELLQPQVDRHMTQLRVLKVVNTESATKKIEKIEKYFKDYETKMLNKEKDIKPLLNESSLPWRHEYLKKLIEKRQKTFSNRIEEIVNNETVCKLDSAQQAEYLRNTWWDSTRDSLSNRIDINEICRREVKQMFEHFREIQDIDDKDHNVSFWSKDTTLGGIKAVCQLAGDNLLDKLEANDIILMLNLVGVACSGPVGSFPDPKTWRVNKIYSGKYYPLYIVINR